MCRRTRKHAMLSDDMLTALSSTQLKLEPTTTPLALRRNAPGSAIVGRAASASDGAGAAAAATVVAGAAAPLARRAAGRTAAQDMQSNQEGLPQQRNTFTACGDRSQRPAGPQHVPYSTCGLVMDRNCHRPHSRLHRRHSRRHRPRPRPADEAHQSVRSRPSVRNTRYVNSIG